jgi:hypothetical protein
VSRWVETTTGVFVDFDNCGRISCHPLPGGKLRVTSIYGQFDLSHVETELVKLPYEAMASFWARREREQLGLPEPDEHRQAPVTAQLPKNLEEARGLVLAAQKSAKREARSNRVAIGVDFDVFRQ